MVEVKDVTREKRVSKISDRVGAGAACLIVYASEDPPQVGRRHELTDKVVTIGRTPDSTIVIESETVSRSHARIERRDRGLILVDCGSVNGTYVGDELVGEHALRSGDLIKIGPCILKYLAAGDIEAAYNEEIYRLTITDGLTGIANRRAFEKTIETEVRRALRHARPLSLVMFDLDHFKKVNDTYGHMAGDHVLKTVASVVRSRIRKEDVFARYGGEEFTLLLHETPKAMAAQLAEEIRAAVADSELIFEGQVIRVTVSMGVAEVAPDLCTPHQLVKAADARLYDAKRGGRNRVAVAHGVPQPQIVTTGLVGPPDHRNHRVPGPPPVISAQFFARADSA
jgi:diguanylate cyclase (GGDEF)-like protein